MSVLEAIDAAIETAQKEKSSRRSERDRVLAVTVTNLQLARGFYATYGQPLEGKETEPDQPDGPAAAVNWNS